ncbi:hypothetical protein [Streptomyces sp. NPDC006267]|uniref:hypothetical protein n=1 Tax=Streptomyces sp. NPDC006267 TaxID=3157173 RepID=UPI0033B6623E
MGQQQVTDDQVMHRAVIDHTVACEECRAGRRCPYLARLREWASAATAIWDARVGAALDKYEATLDYTDSALCRGAALLGAPDAHALCQRIGCTCTCHAEIPT